MGPSWLRCMIRSGSRRQGSLRQVKTLTMIPGEYILARGDIECNAGKEVLSLKVVNTGDRPVQIGSHFHFFEVNKEMEFDRARAFGMRLNIPAGTAVRFEPGEEKKVELVVLGGRRRAVGFNNLVDGDAVGRGPLLEAAMKKVEEQQFKNKTE
jgi:urease subunit beta